MCHRASSQAARSQNVRDRPSPSDPLPIVVPSPGCGAPVRCNLVGAEMLGANLLGANLLGANLLDADLLDADLLDAGYGTAAASRSAASTTLDSNIALVIGPTPPGFGAT